MKKDHRKSFWALIVTQFFGAYNDNVLKTLVTLLVVAWVANIAHRNSLVSASGAIFVAPFLIFSMIAGRVSDRLGKPFVIRATKFWELLVIGAAIASLLNESIQWMMVTLFLLSMQATFFSPAKYGVLPEMLAESDLPEANAYLNLSTFVAILLGTLTAGMLSEKLSWACVVMGLASFFGLVSSFFMGAFTYPLFANWAWGGGWLANLGANFGLGHGYADFAGSGVVHSVGGITDRLLKLGTIAVNYFWFMGAVLQLNIFLYAKDMMGVSDRVASFMLMGVAVGIGTGSYLSGLLSEGKVRLDFVRYGAFGMSLFVMDLAWAYHYPQRAFFDFFMLGVAAGFFDIPLMALIQWRSPVIEKTPAKEEKGQDGQKK